MGNHQTVAKAGFPARHRLTVDDFVALDEAGAFADLGDVELVDGEIFVLSPAHHPHALTHALLITEISLGLRTIRSAYDVLSPVSSHLDEHSLPQPDIVVTSERSDRFANLAAIRLIVEVSSSTMRYDLGKKGRLYARTKVPEYWVADVKGRRIIRMHGPSDDKYSNREEFAFGEPIAAATIDGLVVDTSRLP